MANLNYADSYSRALDQAYPNVLRFGALWNTENRSKYQIIDAKTIKIPHISTKGRVDGDRDSIGTITRNFDNSWETKTLKNHRTWSTLVHPKDISETNQVASIQNITKVMNEEQKFPELDARLISSVYDSKIAKSGAAREETLTIANVLTVFDELMDAMDEALVPANGRILYVDTYTKTLVDNAKDVVRTSGNKVIGRTVSRIDEVEVIGVPTALMKTKYDFSIGAVATVDAKDIAMFLVHPSAVLPVVSYDFAQLEAPSAMSNGKYVYFEESFEDVFLLDYKVGAVAFVLKKSE